MPDEGEPLLGDQSAHAVGEKFFHLVGHIDIDHPTAIHTHHMVVVTFQVFGEFESGTFSRRQNLHDHTGLFENRQVSIDRTLGQVIGRRRDFGGDERMSGLGEHLDEPTSTG